MIRQKKGGAPLENSGSIAKKASFLFRVLIVCGFMALFYISYSIFQQAYKQNQINVEIASLQQEVEDLHQDNQNLLDFVNYIQTDDFKEKEAKDKLNLVKEGETVVLVKEKEVPIRQEAVVEQKKPELVVNRSNYYWWWHLLFSLESH